MKSPDEPTTPRVERNDNEETTAGQQESRDIGNATPANDDANAPTGTAGRQAYDRGGRRPRDFKRSGQIHSDTNDRTG